MVNKCAVVDCRTSYKFKKNESNSLFVSKAVFSFPKDTNLEEKWIKFISRKGKNNLYILIIYLLILIYFSLFCL